MQFLNTPPLTEYLPKTDHHNIDYDQVQEAITPNKPNISYDPLFSQEQLIINNPSMAWLKQMKLELLDGDNLEKIENDPNSFKIDNNLVIALDTETTGLDVTKFITPDGDYVKTQLVGISLSTNPFLGYYIPIMHTEEDGVPNVNITRALKYVQDLIDRGCWVVMHNAQYDIAILSNYGIKFNPNKIIDTMLLHKILNSNKGGNGLKQISEKLGRKMIEINTLLGVDKKEIIEFNRLPAKNALVYAATDATNTIVILDHLSKTKPFDSLFVLNTLKPKPTIQIDMMSTYFITVINQNGIPIDYNKLKKYTEEVMISAKIMEIRINDITGGINISSADQLGQWLAKEIRSLDITPLIPYIKIITLKNGTKEVYPTNDDSINNLKNYTEKDSPLYLFANYLHLWRKLEYKANNLFLVMLRGVTLKNPTPNEWNYFIPIGLRVHNTLTGRLSNSQPNIDRVVVTRELKKMWVKKSEIDQINKPLKKNKANRHYYEELQVNYTRTMNGLGVNIQGIQSETPNYTKVSKAVVDNRFTPEVLNRIKQEVREFLNKRLFEL